MRFPESRRDDSVVDVFGEDIADPYQWLENLDAPKTLAWVDEQDRFARDYLDDLPAREWFAAEIRQILARPRFGTPQRHGNRYFVARNDGTQPQDAWYSATTLDKLLAGGVVAVDPNRLDESGTTSLRTFMPSGDGRYVAYGVSRLGSDWISIHCRDLDTRTDLEEVITGAKHLAPTWLPDNASFLYLNYRPAGPERTAEQGAPQLMLHRLGTTQDHDEAVLDFTDDPHTQPYCEVSYDGAWLVVELRRGNGFNNRLWAIALSDDAGRTRVGRTVRIFDQDDARYDSVRVIASTMLVRTNAGAPQFRLIRVPIRDDVAGEQLAEVIAQDPDATLESVTSAGGSLVTVHLHEATPKLRRYSLGGQESVSIPVHGGAVVALNGRTSDTELFVGMSSTAVPLQNYRVDLQNFDVTALQAIKRSTSGRRTAKWVAPDTVTIRDGARSPDGTGVPYFLIHAADTDLREPRPTLLYAYGGFAFPMTTSFRPGWPAWLRAGGVLVLANIRGGGEFGAAWHDAGRLERKQNVFDDFVAVANELFRLGVTTSDQLAIHGRSHGGLVVGAVLTQHPQIAAAAIPAVGPMDMLRFHRFTGGAAWVGEFGSPDSPDEVDTLLAYSPLHNLRKGTEYPATLIQTSDHDDRVVPSHSYKFAAALQQAQGAEEPILLRVERGAGHGVGKSTEQLAAEWTDLLSFAAFHTGLRPRTTT